MPDDQRIRSAKQAIGNREIQYYDLLDVSIEDYSVAIWQPHDQVDKLTEFPQPADSLEAKATSFLQRAVEAEAHLGLAPEWGYNIEWVADHENLLFGEDGPLFVLGCAQMYRDDLKQVLKEYTESEDFICKPETVPDNDDYDELLTPTIIPLRTTAQDEADAENVLLIQYKNHALGDYANPIEELELIEGEFVWKIDPEDQFLELLALTCSDLLDDDLRQKALEFAGLPNSIIAHVQCNPKPFHGIWTNFRRSLFAAENPYMTYLTANWGDIGANDEDTQLGYSGVYTKADMRTPFRRYNDIYNRGGLPATNPDENSEMIWSVADEDLVSLFRFRRPDPASRGAAGPSSADPFISKTWTWDGDVYITDSPGIPECGADECENWVSQLPDDPRDIELITSIALGEFECNGIDTHQTYDPTEDFNWSSLSNLKANRQEQTNHVLVKNHHRKGHDPASTAAKLNAAFDVAEKQGGIEPIGDVDLADFPVNADYCKHDFSLPIMLSVVDSPSDSAWRTRLKKINTWYEFQQPDDGDRPPFNPQVIRMHKNGKYRLNRLPEYERVDGGSPDPESVVATGKPRRRDQ